MTKKAPRHLPEGSIGRESGNWRSIEPLVAQFVAAIMRRKPQFQVIGKNQLRAFAFARNLRTAVESP